MEINLVNVNGIEMKYAKFGTGAKDMVIIPGLNVNSVLDNAEAVEDYYARFKDDYTVYLIDRRINIPEGYTTRQIADDTVEVMKEIGIKDAYMHGASQGGTILQEIAINYPEMVKKAILASTISKPTEEAIRMVDSWAKWGQEKNREALEEHFVKLGYSDEFFEKFKDMLAGTILTASDEKLDKFAILAEALKGFDTYDRLNQIQCETLVMGATGDKMFDYKDQIDMAEKIGCDYYMFEGYSHCVYDEAPDYLDKLEEFFDK